jgi:hypothetical protein
MARSEARSRRVRRCQSDLVVDADDFEENVTGG